MRVIPMITTENDRSEACLVLGGCPFREVEAAHLKKQNPALRILISGGSPDPCLYLIFKKANAPLKGVWTEHCSQTTLDNFVNSLHILKSWGVRKVTIISDYPQLYRALPPAKIFFGAHGIRTEAHAVPNRYISMDERTPLVETELFIAMCGWALLSQLYEPVCDSLTNIEAVDMKAWYKTGFDCQPQTGVNSHPINTPN